MSAPPTCRRCGASIVWSRGDRGWLPLEPESASEHVLGDDGKIIFDARLGHLVHRCAGASGRAPGPAASETPTLGDGNPLGELEEALLSARQQVEAALVLLRRASGKRTAS